MAEREPQQVTSSGVAATAHPATAGPGNDTVPGDCTVRVVNGGGVSTTLTVTTPGVVDGDLAIANRDVVVAAGQSRYVRVNRKPYEDPATGRVTLTWSATASVTFEVIRP